MSSFAVTAEKIEILPHPNADALELAAVGGYRAVVAKGAYRSGDYALYIPELAILPDVLIDELGLTGKLAGKAANRVKAIRLRGELSQGIVCRPAVLAGCDLAAAAASRTCFADQLGITKWVPEVPADMAGEMIAAPSLIGWIDIENIKRFPDIFAPGEVVTASEKTHGTCTLATADMISGEMWVSSKGFGSRRLAIKEDPNNLYWRALRVHDVEAKMRAIATALGAVRIGLFGETYGAGVQDLTYGVASRNQPGYAAFDAYIECAAGSARWLNQDELRTLASAVGLAVMPELYRGPYDYGTLAALAEGPSVIGAGANIREGLVVRPLIERYSDVLGGRAIAKFVGAGYLTRKGDTTEFE
jgi:RNA ligase (TIGR02306 family)